MSQAGVEEHIHGHGGAEDTAPPSITTAATAATATTGGAKQREEKKLRRKKKKEKKARSKAEERERRQQQGDGGDGSADEEDSENAGESAPAVEIEYVTNTEDLAGTPFAAFASVFAKFQFPDTAQKSEEVPVKEEPTKGKGTEDMDEDEDEDDKKKDNEDGKVSKKKLRKLRRLGISDLKQKAKKPEVVEWVDVTASDPMLLVYLKAYRNTVPVPRHWSQKRKYLQGKRGLEKPAFELPEFIKNTGIAELRDAVREKEETMKMKTKMRERVQPKLGKLEIDYQKLHDAFFKFQTKPAMTAYGDMYYEGKEFEVRVKEKKPGSLSEELKMALSIPPGAPPPWLINMQRYGPPPSYPHLKIPGLNSPIPETAQWGYHPGGWGKPPVDEFGNPLYGDVFGTSIPPPPPPENTQPVERNLWGKVEEEQYESEEESEAEGSDQEDKDKEVDQEGLETPSGLSSVASGLETPDKIELRKDVKRPGDETPDAPPVQANRQLFTVIPQKEVKGSGFMASGYTYDFNAAKKEPKKVGEGVEVAFDPAEMESIDENKIKQLFEQKTEKKDDSDLSSMVAEHAAQQSKKRKKPDTKSSSSSSSSSSGGSKKSKDFKF